MGIVYEVNEDRYWKSLRQCQAYITLAINLMLAFKWPMFLRFITLTSFATFSCPYPALPCPALPLIRFTFVQLSTHDAWAPNMVESGRFSSDTVISTLMRLWALMMKNFIKMKRNWT